MEYKLTIRLTVLPYSFSCVLDLRLVYKTSNSYFTRSFCKGNVYSYCEPCWAWVYSISTIVWIKILMSCHYRQIVGRFCWAFDYIFFIRNNSSKIMNVCLWGNFVDGDESVFSQLFLFSDFIFHSFIIMILINVIIICDNYEIEAWKYEVF